MEEKSYSLYVRNPGVFWSSLQTWVKRLIVVIGGLIGLSLWFAGFSASFLFVALIFMGTAPVANYVKILVIVVSVATLFVTPILTTWLLRLAVYAVARLAIMNNDDAPIGEHIFKTRE